MNLACWESSSSEPVRHVRINFYSLYTLPIVGEGLVRLLPLLEGWSEVWEELYDHNLPDPSK